MPSPCQAFHVLSTQMFILLLPWKRYAWLLSWFCWVRPNLKASAFQHYGKDLLSNLNTERLPIISLITGKILLGPRLPSMGFILEYFRISLSQFWGGVSFPSLTKCPGTILLLSLDLKVLLLAQMQKNSFTFFPQLTAWSIAASATALCRIIKGNNIIHQMCQKLFLYLCTRIILWHWGYLLSRTTKTQIPPWWSKTAASCARWGSPPVSV